MSLKIKLRKLKNISALDFSVPTGGVYLLCGANGSGKTTLLACLARLGESDSFPRHFRTSNISQKLDQFANAEISYEFTDSAKSVTYAYSGYRWEPSPKRNSADLGPNSGFAAILYVAADEARVTPRREDFRTDRIKPAPDFIQSNANSVLGTAKFTNLRTVNVRRGLGQQAFVLEVSPQEFVSEKNFSLGELAVLKLLRKLEACPNNALVIIDELEIALHPVAQERLLTFLRKISKEKTLTVIFSTHSATLIRAVDSTEILFLERRGSNVACVSPCYPTYALGHIAPPTDLSPDIVILVEDEHAQTLVHALIKQAIGTLFEGRATPSVVCQPIGGYGEVLRFLASSRQLFTQSTKLRALLDGDCEPLFAPRPGHQQVAGASVEQLRVFQQHQNLIRFLPAAPELGLVNAASDVDAGVLPHLARAFVNNAILALQLPVALDATAEGRRKAKVSLREFAKAIALIAGRTETDVRKALYEWYVARMEIQQRGAAAALLGPVIV